MKRFPHIHQLTRTHKKRGYLTLLAVLVSSVLLTIGLSVSHIALREIQLAGVARTSQDAFMSASRGIECAMYWDRGFPQNGLNRTRFQLSSGDTTVPTSAATCEGNTISNGWAVSGVSATGATTKFTVNFGSPCTGQAVVSVQKVLSSTIYTQIISEGYGDCNTLNPRRTQRKLVYTIAGEYFPLQMAPIGTNLGQTTTTYTPPTTTTNTTNTTTTTTNTTNTTNTTTTTTSSAVTCGKVARGSTLALSCASGQTISSVDFASYGTPTGSCPTFTRSACHEFDTPAAVQSRCLGKAACSILANEDLAGSSWMNDYGVCNPASSRSLAVKVTCQ